MTRAQLLALGAGKRQIESQQQAGLLFRVHYGVYAVGHLPTHPLDRARGALLAAGPRSALARATAAAFWGLSSDWPEMIEILSPRVHRIPTLRTGRCRTLLRRDVRVDEGITVTGPARTLLDIAPHTAAKTLQRFHNELRMRRLIGNAQILDVAARNPRHPGATPLTALAKASAGEAKRSPFEVDWPPFAAMHHLPPYER